MLNGIFQKGTNYIDLIPNTFPTPPTPPPPPPTPFHTPLEYIADEQRIFPLSDVEEMTRSHAPCSRFILNELSTTRFRAPHRMNNDVQPLRKLLLFQRK